MKHIIKRLILLTLLSGILTITPLSAQTHPHDCEVRNVILMIGDGMGLGQIASLMIENNYEPISFDRAQYTGVCKTYSANNRITDSAASGTAMATGHKTDNGRIGTTPNGAPAINLTELAHAKGLSTGIVVTSDLADATPAAFAAHAQNRHDSEQITASYATAHIDVLVGGGRKLFASSLDGRNIIDELQAAGYCYTSTPEEFYTIGATPVVGLFADKYMPMANVRGEEYLARATTHTLDLLSHNPKGFFVMIEGSQIDKACHQNNTDVLHAEMRDFDNAVHAAFDFADTHPGTLVVVVADHETGGLTIVSNNRDFTVEESGIKYKYSTTSHSATPVILFAYGTGAEYFSGMMENTDIFHKIKLLLIEDKE